MNDQTDSNIFDELMKHYLVRLDRGGAKCYDPIVITGPRTFHIQTISGIFATQMMRDE